MIKKTITALLVVSSLTMMVSATTKPEVTTITESQMIDFKFDTAAFDAFKSVDIKQTVADSIHKLSELYNELEKATYRPWTDNDIEILAKMVYGEGNAVSRDEKKLIVWCVLNRVDHYNESIEAIVTAPSQYHGYKTYHPVTPENVEVIEEVLEEWFQGEEALILPPYSYTSDYLYFGGDMKNNYFRENY